MINSNDTIGNQTRDLPTCSAVPKPTALPRAPFIVYILLKLSRRLSVLTLWKSNPEPLVPSPCVQAVLVEFSEEKIHLGEISING